MNFNRSTGRNLDGPAMYSESLIPIAIYEWTKDSNYRENAVLAALQKMGLYLRRVALIRAVCLDRTGKLSGRLESVISSFPNFLINYRPSLFRFVPVPARNTTKTRPRRRVLRYSLSTSRSFSSFRRNSTLKVP